MPVRQNGRSTSAGGPVDKTVFQKIGFIHIFQCDRLFIDRRGKRLKAAIPALSQATEHFDDFEDTEAFAEDALEGDVHGIHAFGDSDIYGAVYSTNLLMRACDLLATKPSELAFYPVPKLMIKRVGGHEAWGAIRAAEVGDGTYELETLPETCAMIDLMQAEPSIIADMCDNIEAADAIGIYDGAYRVVQLATQATQE